MKVYIPSSEGQVLKRKRTDLEIYLQYSSKETFGIIEYDFFKNLLVKDSAANKKPAAHLSNQEKNENLQ